MNIEAPQGPLTVVDGKGTTPYGFRWSEYDRSRGIAPVLRKMDYRNHASVNACLIPWVNPAGTSPVDPANPILVEDCKFTRAINPDPNYHHYGTDEFNLQLGGHSVARRFVCKGALWAGIWRGGMTSSLRGGCWRSLMHDFRSKDQSIGIYDEHDTRHSVAHSFEIEATYRGVVSEWWYWEPERQKMGGSCFNTYAGFVIDLSKGPASALAFELSCGTFGSLIANGFILSPYPDESHIELPVRVCNPDPTAPKRYMETRQTSQSSFTCDYPNVVHNVIHVDTRPGIDEAKRCKPANVTYTDKAIGWTGNL